MGLCYYSTPSTVRDAAITEQWWYSVVIAEVKCNNRLRLHQPPRFRVVLICAGASAVSWEHAESTLDTRALVSRVST